MGVFIRKFSEIGHRGAKRTHKKGTKTQIKGESGGQNMLYDAFHRRFGDWRPSVVGSGENKKDEEKRIKTRFGTSQTHSRQERENQPPLTSLKMCRTVLISLFFSFSAPIIHHHHPTHQIHITCGQEESTRIPKWEGMYRCLRPMVWSRAPHRVTSEYTELPANCENSLDGFHGTARSSKQGDNHVGEGSSE